MQNNDISKLPAIRCEGENITAMAIIGVFINFINQNLNRIESIPMAISFDDLRLDPQEKALTAKSMRLGLNVILKK